MSYVVTGGIKHHHEQLMMSVFWLSSKMKALRNIMAMERALSDSYWTAANRRTKSFSKGWSRQPSVWKAPWHQRTWWYGGSMNLRVSADAVMYESRNCKSLAEAWVWCHRAGCWCRSGWQMDALFSCGCSVEMVDGGGRNHAAAARIVMKRGIFCRNQGPGSSRGWSPPPNFLGRETKVRCSLS